MKIKLCVFALFTIFLLVTHQCQAKTHVIILVDSRIFVNNDNIANFDSFQRSACDKFLEKIWRFDAPDNTYSLYTFAPENENFQAKEIFFGKHWHDLDLNKPAEYADLTGAELFTNMYNFLKYIDGRTLRQSPADLSDSTVFVIFSKSSFPYANGSSVPTIFTLKEIINNGGIKIDYTVNPPVSTEPLSLLTDTFSTKKYIMLLPVSQYAVKRSINNVFLNANQNEKIPVSFDCIRKTVPGANYLGIYTKDNYRNLTVNLPLEDKIMISSVILNYIKGKDSQTNLVLSKQPVEFSSQYNTLPPVLTGTLSNGIQVPLYEMIQPYLKLNANTPVDTAYTGQMVIKYRLLDPIYSHANFSDTINFKFNLDKPRYLNLGLSKHVLLDNAALIKYGNEFSPRKACTQDELCNAHKSTLRIVIYIVIVILIFIIIILWFFLRKNKKLTLANLRTFWK